MANCFTHGHHLPRTTSQWDSALVWYLQHSDKDINPGPPPPPPPTVEREWRETLHRMRRTNFSCLYSAMDDGPSYKAVTDPPFTASTEKRLQFDDKFQHPLYEPTSLRHAVEQPVTGVIPRTYAPPYVPLPGAPAEQVAEYEKYEAARRRWQGTTSARAETPGHTVFH
ncbi:uncharacterized protein LOC122369826 [Amphibalanus amphitrite]|uniref:uncharacterized protein LOC122366748 n=1 Tax=Amphibalanus amphitrite TaxID=1232801 RepID=UPI001C9059B8|nr:uncharacterized protein LOC122366748 [Amphibalanus amphitrite]XP_043200819.1 uncharacterized protein LOC122369826 [Amphibalanus amphitrite]